MLMTACTSCLY